MAVSTDVSLITLLQHKQVFFSFLDFLDDRRDGEEIPLALYHSLVRELLAKQSRIEEQRLREIFKVDNLQRCGLLMDIDRSRGVLVFQGFVLEMFRHLDRTRLRELSSIELESLRQQLIDLHQRIAGAELVPDTDDYREAIVLLFDRLRGVKSRIRQNVESLQGQVQRLAEVMALQDSSDIDRTSQVREALSHINRIYQRHVLPTLQFLNEREDLKDGETALVVIERIAESFEGRGFTAHAQRIRYIKNSIRSHAKDIEAIRRSLERYVRQHRIQRHRYNSIEAAYNQLLGTAETLHDGGLKTKYLSANAPVFSLGRCFSGLKRQIFGRNIDWADYDNYAWLQEWLRVESPKLDVQQDRNKTVTLGGEMSLRVSRDRERARKKIAIQKLMGRFEIPGGVLSDTHLELHRYMSEHLTDYQLSDLIEGAAWLRGRSGIALYPRFVIKSIDHKTQRLEYYQLSLKEESAV
tara:strand:- start:2068 stop:3468 length:1401 start_codon:yes stop_codon:yes gene_type:complete